MGFRASKLAQWQTDAADRLLRLYTAAKEKNPGLTQAVFVEAGIGDQSYVSQLMRKLRPISAEAAAKFAGALGCKVDDFSTELADQVRQLSGSVTWPPHDPRGWPLPISPERWAALSPERRASIARYVSEQTALDDLDRANESEKGAKEGTRGTRAAA